jgi:hypothetical protein
LTYIFLNHKLKLQINIKVSILTMKIIKLGIMFASLLCVLLVSAPVYAISEASSNSNTQNPRVTPTANNNSQASERKEALKAKLSEAKLKACQNRERNVNSIMARIFDRGQKQLDLFTKIAERTEKFYKDSGKILANYDALVADVNAKQTAAQTAVKNIETNGNTFSCEGADPKGVVTAFKANLKNEIEALKAFKTSVKNLIVGVKSVQGTTSSAPATTPSPTTQGAQ